MKNKLNLNRHELLVSPVIRNIFGIGVFRILGIISNLFLIGLIYRYFSDDEMNGIWLTISSILTWITFFDFGMGNSLRNKLTESLSKKDSQLSNYYISTTYIIMLVPTLLIIILGLTFAGFIDWEKMFNITNNKIANNYISLFISILFILFSVNFYLSMIYAVLHAMYKSYIIPMIQVLVNIINIILVTILILLNINSLILLGTIYIGTSIIVLLFTTLWIFKFNKHHLTINFKYFKWDLVKDIINVGLQFFVLQISIIVLFNTDNFLISRYIGVEHVTTYHLLNKLLSINTIILGIVLTPVWTKVIRDKVKSVGLIKNTLKRLLTLFLLLVIGAIIVGYLSPLIIKIWTGTSMSIQINLIILIVLFTVIHMWCNIFQNILNGLNKLNLQVLCYGLASIINIPLSIYLVLNTNLGVSAIILGTIISLIIPGLILPIYTFNYFKSIS
ncbi:oligosaccharide flippase family protein [Cytobacillus firmus]|uniref:oligosaccharide flippase family protein n=1 Tax=Cytobacillus firmus TaxID=1399 RepID=UPI0036B1AD16